MVKKNFLNQMSFYVHENRSVFIITPILANSQSEDVIGDNFFLDLAGSHSFQDMKFMVNTCQLEKQDPVPLDIHWRQNFAANSQFSLFINSIFANLPTGENLFVTLKSILMTLSWLFTDLRGEAKNLNCLTYMFPAEA